jgi:ubiquinone/menaquinone biosynthesis C-methylase UbiE
LNNYWAALVMAIVSAAAVIVARTAHQQGWLLIASGILLIVSVFVLGYAARAQRHRLWAPLSHLQRRQYAEVWNSLATSEQIPRVALLDVAEDEPLGPSTAHCVQNLLQLAQVSSADEVLEVGCGSGRIGMKLAPICSTWTGADISSKMLSLAASRLAAMQNVRLVQLESGLYLNKFPAGSFDVVYITSVIGHLDEIDRWRYVEEAFRVLRPGGRLLLDNIDIESEIGWSMFLNDVRRYQALERPPYMPRFSTATELANYAKRAGFDEVAVHPRSPEVVLFSSKFRECASAAVDLRDQVSAR